MVDAFLQFGDYRRGYVHRAQLARLPPIACGRGTPRAPGRPQLVHRVAAVRSRGHDGAGVLGQAAAVVDLLRSCALDAVSFLLGIWLGVATFTSNVGQMALGWTSIIISHLFLSGLLLMSLGVVGLYIGRIFEQVKQRPIFVVRETRNVGVRVTCRLVNLSESRRTDRARGIATGLSIVRRGRGASLAVRLPREPTTSPAFSRGRVQPPKKAFNAIRPGGRPLEKIRHRLQERGRRGLRAAPANDLLQPDRIDACRL